MSVLTVLSNYSGWADSETLDWADMASGDHTDSTTAARWPAEDAAEQTASDLQASSATNSNSSSIAWGEDSIFWERGLPPDDLTATLDLTLIRGPLRERQEREAVVPTKEEDSSSDSGIVSFARAKGPGLEIFFRVSFLDNNNNL